MARSEPEPDPLDAASPEDAPVPGTDGRANHPKTRRFKKTKRALIIVAVLVLVLVASGAGYAWYLNHKITRIAVKGLAEAPDQGSSTSEPRTSFWSVRPPAVP